MSPLQQIFRNDSVARCENHLAEWIDSTQRRLPDAALADLGALIARFRAAASAEPEAEGVAAHRLELDGLPAAARLRKAARDSGARRRAGVMNALTDETGSLAAGIEDWLRRTATWAHSAGGK